MDEMDEMDEMDKIGRIGRIGCGTGGEGFVMGWGRQSGGVALLNHRIQACTPTGVRICGVWFPVVSLVPSSTTG